MNSHGHLETKLYYPNHYPYNQEYVGDCRAYSVCPPGKVIPENFSVHLGFPALRLV